MAACHTYRTSRSVECTPHLFVILRPCLSLAWVLESWPAQILGLVLDATFLVARWLDEWIEWIAHWTGSGVITEAESSLMRALCEGSPIAYLCITSVLHHQARDFGIDLSLVSLVA